MSTSKKYFRWRRQGDELEISVQGSLSEREPLLATCCFFIDTYYVVLDLSPDKKKYLVILSPKEEAHRKNDARRVMGEFYNELLHNLLRYRIASRNQKVREMVVKEALFFSQPKREQSKVVRQLVREGKVI